MQGRILQDKEQHIYNITILTDIILSVVTFYASVYIRANLIQRNFAYSKEYLLLGLLIVVTWFILLKSDNFQKFHRTKSYSAIFIEYAKGILIGSIVLSGAIFFFKLDTISRSIIFLFAPINLIVLFSSRIIFYEILKNYRANGKNVKNILIIGDETAEKVIEKIRRHKEWGFKIVRIISSSEALIEKFGEKYSFLPEKVQIHRLLELDTIDEVVFCKNNIDQKELHSILYSCEEVGVAFRMQSNLWNLAGKKYHLSYFEEMPFFTFMNKPSDYFALMTKNIMDISLAALMILFLSPVLLAVALAIKIDSKGPVLFKQMRVGLRGRKFYIYKFRTMVTNAEELKAKLEEQNEMDGPVFKIKHDPRITRVGRFLRKSGLDELPQLFNVLRGEMSFIGPRPPIHEEVVQYKRWQLRRLSMKPGITCIWQTMPDRNSISFQKWMQLDLQYIDTWSLKQDIILFFKTVRTVFMGSGS